MKSRQIGIGIAVLSVVALCAVGALRLELRRGGSSTGGLLPGVRLRTEPGAVVARYLGAHVCAGCHPAEFRDHARSNHAKTLRPMRRDRMPPGFPRSQRFGDPDVRIGYELQEAFGRYTLTAYSGRGVESREIDLALGSGKAAMTFVSRDGPNAIRELRMTYFPHEREWIVTPGQQGPETDPIGAVHEGKRAQRCMTCHSTVLAESRLLPEERFMGVGCEACHGPGQAHVAAVKAGRAPGEIRRFGSWGSKRLNEFCGECHRSPAAVDPRNEVLASQTQRFQPYGLMKSACFQKSGDRLSCVTCHNPHRNAEHSAAGYERVCRSCHAPGARVCPVNSRSGCTGCHMPRRPLMPHIAMADHWIRVFDTGRKRQGADPQ